ncbi:hypothetical protein DV26_19405 [Amycolatopsis mediterranei]|uniref:Uncharacterized protein n=1 Tax=Amycolatopsis mediterranei (strain S699) TaxID=713604 RepID=A0A9R0NU09_AMYMS|nr:hypothetical protein RAM_10430 [Amycolatopsis mediterranei S699]KDO09132.1 hypothetical protein DV26_19405 [Amycolatopsis mediterranei]KDU92876.1 hypothetical protein DV36_07490 [Amycolatopsis mediterranei]
MRRGSGRAPTCQATAGVLDAVAGGAAVLAALVVDAGAAGAGGGASGEHALRVRASAAPAAAFRHIRPAWQKRSPAETTRSSDTVLGPLGLGY